MKYKVKKIIDKVYLVTTKKHYDLCMLFLRYQEFYESPNPKFRGKPFELLDFMEWYSGKYGEGAFLYPVHWSGFNIPSRIIEEVHCEITDWNKYDEEMNKIRVRLVEEVGGDDYYLIGAPQGKADTLDHEVAHGLFYTVPSYREEMTELVRKLDKTFYKEICSWLKKHGYTREVFVDEAQAYMSTGLPKELEKSGKKYIKAFKSVYKKYR